MKKLEFFSQEHIERLPKGVLIETCTETETGIFQIIMFDFNNNCELDVAHFDPQEFREEYCDLMIRYFKMLIKDGVI